MLSAAQAHPADEGAAWRSLCATSTVQFTISRRAADALPIESVLPGARAAGVPSARLEYSTVHAGAGKMRITCSVETATYLVARLTELATSLEGKNQTQLIWSSPRERSHGVGWES